MTNCDPGEGYDFKGWDGGEPPFGEPPHPAWTTVLLVAIIVAAIMLLAFSINAALAPAHSEEAVPTDTACAPAQVMLARLKSKYGEEPVAIGMSQRTMRGMIITANPDGSSWSYLTVVLTGQLCMLDAGFGYKVPPAGDPT